MRLVLQTHERLTDPGDVHDTVDRAERLSDPARKVRHRSGVPHIARERREPVPDGGEP